MNWTRLAAIVPLVFLGYQLLLDWVNLFPWNDVAAKPVKMRVLETLVNYSPLLLISYGFWVPSSSSKLWALLGSVAYLLGHLHAWWRPYFFGASAKQQQEYAQLFARTYKFLPPIKNHPVPDGAHVVLGGICALLVLCSLLAYLQP